MVYAHQHEMPEPLAQRCGDLVLPPGLDELVQRCVAKSPADRPRAPELVTELDRLLAQTPSSGGARRAQRLFTSRGMSNMAQALTSQIRQVLLDLAATLERSTDDIERIQHELSELELDLAMVESDLEAAPLATGPSHDLALRQRRDAIAAAVAQLQSGLADAFRELFDAINGMRTLAPADARPLYDELDSLVALYHTNL
jgi:hypothetical protein